MRHGKGGRRREIGMDQWGLEQLRPWLDLRLGIPVGPLLCVIEGGAVAGPGPATPTARYCAASPPRPEYVGGSRPTSFVTLTRSSRARGRAAQRHPASARAINLGVTSIYLQGIDNTEIIATVFARHAPMIPASAELRPGFTSTPPPP